MAKSRGKSTFEQAVERYLFHLQDKRCSWATIRWHRHHLGTFAKWAEPRWSSPFIAEWHKNDSDSRLMKDYLAHASRLPSARGGQRSAAYLRSIHSSLRGFCLWLVEEEVVLFDFLSGAPKPKVPEQIKPRFTADEVQRLVAAIKAFSRNPLRDVALVRFMLDTGCRASEVCTLREKDIDWDERRATVIGKGSKERFIFFSPGVAQVMRRYWAEERPGRTPYFFEKESGGSMSAETLLRICKRWSTYSGIHVNPHKFRHTFAITYLNAGGDVFALQKRLGHSTLQISEHYAKHASEDLAREHDEHSPDQFFLAGKRR